jgi:hypothetical protein
MNKCRCDERLQTKTKEFTRLPYTGLVFVLCHQGLCVYYESRKRESCCNFDKREKLVGVPME